jgi:hypothetical protein
MKPPCLARFAFSTVLVACGLAFLATMARADDSTASLAAPSPAETGTAATAKSDDYPQVTCTGVNPALVSDVLQLAEDTRETLTPLLKLGPKWRYPVHITLLAPLAQAATATQGESVSVVTNGKTLQVDAALPSSAPNAHEFIQRQFVTALLWEKFFKPDTTFTASTRLDVVPLWLVEGLREMLNEDPTHNREEIVKRAALAQRAPTLAQVTGWKELSNDRLLNLWQRAFCYYLVDCLTHPQARLEDFQGWLASITGPNPKTAEYLFPTEMGWQRELASASSRDRALVYTWDQTSAELTADQTIALPTGKHADETELCTIDTVATFPRTTELDRAVNAKIFQLTALELRAHPGWQPVIELYRFGLAALLHDPTSQQAVQYLHEARVRRIGEMTQHQNLLDYMNWYEVTQNTPIQASHFRDYFRTAQELDKIEPDPAHPNPLRADLLKVEAKF